jgi:pimeloyl-ACP methyl ester carboxylesterase
MIGGGTRGWLKEELSNAGPLEREDLRRRIREIYKHPRSKKMWNGFSFATWYSYREDSTLKALCNLKLPALAILGGRDRTIDFKTARRDYRKLMTKQPLKLKILGNCGHSFVSHWADAWNEVRKFLASNF